MKRRFPSRRSVAMGFRGAVAARFGKLGLDQVLGPAIDYAEHAFPVSEGRSYGGIQLIMVDPESGALLGASDP